MKFAYIDESGISVNERILVVAGVIIDADSQWKRVADYLDVLVTEFVPKDSRAGFVFHATRLFHKSGPVPVERSHEALRAILTIPAQFNLSIAFGYLAKATLLTLPDELPQKLRRKQARVVAGVTHSIAFSLCAIGVETFMQQDTPANEIATLVVENNTDTQRDIKSTYNIMKGRNLKAGMEQSTFDFLSERHAGRLPIRRIIDVPHMVQKHEASLLQIADACAMVVRYCLEEKVDAQSFIDVLSARQSEKIHMNGLAKSAETPAGFNILTFSKREGLAK